MFKILIRRELLLKPESFKSAGKLPKSSVG